MSGSQKVRVNNKPVSVSNNVVQLYQVRPEMALEHLKRSTGLDFHSIPESLVNPPATEDHPADAARPEPPLLTEIVERC